MPTIAMGMKPKYAFICFLCERQRSGDAPLVARTQQRIVRLHLSSGNNLSNFFRLASALTNSLFILSIKSSHCSADSVTPISASFWVNFGGSQNKRRLKFSNRESFGPIAIVGLNSRRIFTFAFLHPGVTTYPGNSFLFVTVSLPICCDY